MSALRESTEVVELPPAPCTSACIHCNACLVNVMDSNLRFDSRSHCLACGCHVVYHRALPSYLPNPRGNFKTLSSGFVGPPFIWPRLELPQKSVAVEFMLSLSDIDISRARRRIFHDHSRVWRAFNKGSSKKVSSLKGSWYAEARVLLTTPKSEGADPTGTPHRPNPSLVQAVSMRHRSSTAATSGQVFEISQPLEDIAEERPVSAPQSQRRSIIKDHLAEVDNADLDSSLRLRQGAGRSSYQPSPARWGRTDAVPWKEGIVKFRKAICVRVPLHPELFNRTHILVTVYFDSDRSHKCVCVGSAMFSAQEALPTLWPSVESESKSSQQAFEDFVARTKELRSGSVRGRGPGSSDRGSVLQSPALRMKAAAMAQEAHEADNIRRQAVWEGKPLSRDIASEVDVGATVTLHGRIVVPPRVYSAARPVRGTELVQSFVLPTQRKGRCLVVSEEAIESEYSTLVPCQYLLHRAEQLQEVKELLEKKIAALEERAISPATEEEKVEEERPAPAAPQEGDKLTNVLEGLSALGFVHQEQKMTTDAWDLVCIPSLRKALRVVEARIVEYAELAEGYSKLYFNARRYGVHYHTRHWDVLTQRVRMLKEVKAKKGICRQGDFFKPSTHKDKPMFKRAMPTNLHLQLLTVEERDMRGNLDGWGVDPDVPNAPSDGSTPFTVWEAAASASASQPRRASSPGSTTPGSPAEAGRGQSGPSPAGEQPAAGKRNTPAGPFPPLWRIPLPSAPRIASVYDTITFGAPASHFLKFKNGGLSRQRLDILYLGVSDAFVSEFIRGWLYAINNKTLRDEFAPDQLALSDMQLQRLKNVPEDDDFDEVVMPTSSVVHSTESGLNLFHSAIQLQAREDLVMCQLLAGVVSAITLRLDHSVASNANLYLRGVARVGWLVHVESLLSTRGKEEGMLEDLYTAMRLLRGVCIRIVKRGTATPSAGAAKPTPEGKSEERKVPEAGNNNDYLHTETTEYEESGPPLSLDDLNASPQRESAKSEDSGSAHEAPVTEKPSPRNPLSPSSLTPQSSQDSAEASPHGPNDASRPGSDAAVEGVSLDESDPPNIAAPQAAAEAPIEQLASSPTSSHADSGESSGEDASELDAEDEAPFTARSTPARRRFSRLPPPPSEGFQFLFGHGALGLDGSIQQLAKSTPAVAGIMGSWMFVTGGIEVLLRRRARAQGRNSLKVRKTRRRAVDPSAFGLSMGSGGVAPPPNDMDEVTAGMDQRLTQDNRHISFADSVMSGPGPGYRQSFSLGRYDGGSLASDIPEDSQGIMMRPANSRALRRRRRQVRQTIQTYGVAGALPVSLVSMARGGITGSGAGLASPSSAITSTPGRSFWGGGSISGSLETGSVGTGGVGAGAGAGAGAVADGDAPTAGHGGPSVLVRNGSFYSVSKRSGSIVRFGQSPAADSPVTATSPAETSSNTAAAGETLPHSLRVANRSNSLTLVVNSPSASSAASPGLTPQDLWLSGSGTPVTRKRGATVESRAGSVTSGAGPSSVAGVGPRQASETAAAATPRGSFAGSLYLPGLAQEVTSPAPSRRRSRTVMTDARNAPQFRGMGSSTSSIGSSNAEVERRMSSASEAFASRGHQLTGSANGSIRRSFTGIGPGLSSGNRPMYSLAKHVITSMRFSRRTESRPRVESMATIKSEGPVSDSDGDDEELPSTPGTETSVDSDGFGRRDSSVSSGSLSSFSSDEEGFMPPVVDEEVPEGAETEALNVGGREGEEETEEDGVATLELAMAIEGERLIRKQEEARARRRARALRMSVGGTSTTHGQQHFMDDAWDSNSDFSEDDDMFGDAEEGEEDGVAASVALDAMTGTAAPDGAAAVSPAEASNGSAAAETGEGSERAGWGIASPASASHTASESKQWLSSAEGILQQLLSPARMAAAAMGNLTSPVSLEGDSRGAAAGGGASATATAGVAEDDGGSTLRPDALTVDVDDQETIQSFDRLPPLALPVDGLEELLRTVGHFPEWELLLDNVTTLSSSNGAVALAASAIASAAASLVAHASKPDTAGSSSRAAPFGVELSGRWFPEVQNRDGIPELPPLHAVLAQSNGFLELPVSIGLQALRLAGQVAKARTQFPRRVLDRALRHVRSLYSLWQVSQDLNAIQFHTVPHSKLGALMHPGAVTFAGVMDKRNAPGRAVTGMRVGGPSQRQLHRPSVEAAVAKDAQRRRVADKSSATPTAGDAAAQQKGGPEGRRGTQTPFFYFRSGSRRPSMQPNSVLQAQRPKSAPLQAHPETLVSEDAAAGLLGGKMKREAGRLKGDAVGRTAASQAESCGMLIDVAVPEDVYDALPDDLRGTAVPIVPVLFSQGINEQQSIANKLNHNSVQKEINRESFYVLEAFILKTGRVAVGPRMRDLEVLRKQLKAKIYEEATSNAKHPEILSISSDIVRLLHGLRLTCCKSGKDRTAMSVTLEEARILAARHNVPASRVFDTAQALRQHGIRLPVCYKNVGKPAYAFNSLQLKLLPPQYRPPQTTISSSVAT